MKFSDEELMAYADGELDAAQRAQIERAMQEDPAVAAAVARHQSLRSDVFAAFAGVLDEPVPPVLQPQTDELSAARARREARRHWGLPHWAAMAASLAIGVFAGLLGTRQAPSTSEALLAADASGRLVARGALADALSQQLASEPGKSPIQPGISFLARDGSYCRSFTAQASAGLACREGGNWVVPMIQETEAGQQGGIRQAAAQLPPAVLDAIDGRIDGQALDATAERAARERHWQR
ncbi:anti-sigma factor family protein [Massilia endophytica]|uniref:anti-sigma factor family protein n=1 Tax=Massilia endophytica TaxID=2899220 RepID=UPI001E38D383|nr:hypothetical protein [Massilia endophytica]UGQ46393.1 hypothetical protein LSQ66_21935 [Massilia endophytica]